MTLEGFWQIIADSRRDFDPARRDGNMDRQAEILEELLSQLPDDDLLDFHRIFESQFHRAYRCDLWRAAYLINSGCSDDCFMDFRNWLISIGRETFEAALENPDSLAAVVRAPGVEACEFQEFGSIPAEVLEERGIEVPHAAWPSQPAGET